jgi:hypothetical protein
MQRYRTNDSIARHLLELGCTKKQVERHLARGRSPTAVARSRPHPDDWLSWASRIRKADPRPKIAGGLK